MSAPVLMSIGTISGVVTSATVMWFLKGARTPSWCRPSHGKVQFLAFLRIPEIIFPSFQVCLKISLVAKVGGDVETLHCTHFLTRDVARPIYLFIYLVDFCAAFSRAKMWLKEAHPQSFGLTWLKNILSNIVTAWNPEFRNVASSIEMFCWFISLENLSVQKS